ncbi:MAG: hypothetical protein R3B70_00920 [Polyangiaceae bacterium]
MALTGTRVAGTTGPLVALMAGILPNLPGFLGTIKVAKVAPLWMTLYNYAPGS